MKSTVLLVIVEHEDDDDASVGWIEEAISQAPDAFACSREVVTLDGDEFSTDEFDVSLDGEFL